MSDISEKRQCDAEEAVKAADLGTLKRLFDESEKKVELLKNGLALMVGEGATNPITTPSDSVVEAMRDVALAAIALARDVSRVERGSP